MIITVITPNQALQAARYFVAALNDKFGTDYTFSFTAGTQFIRVVQEPVRGAGQSVHCFIDMNTGEVLKAASWQRPANGARFASVYDAIDHADPHGSYLYKGRS